MEYFKHPNFRKPLFVIVILSLLTVNALGFLLTYYLYSAKLLYYMGINMQMTVIFATITSLFLLALSIFICAARSKNQFVSRSFIVLAGILIFLLSSISLGMNLAKGSFKPLFDSECSNNMSSFAKADNLYKMSNSIICSIACPCEAEVEKWDKSTQLLMFTKHSGATRFQECKAFEVATNGISFWDSDTSGNMTLGLNTAGEIEFLF